MAKRAIKVNNSETTPNASKAGPLVLNQADLIPLVDELSQAKNALEENERKIQALRATLDPIVIEARDKAEKQGHFTKSVQVKGSQANAGYSFRDSYAPIDTCAQDDLKSLLKNNYELLFTTSKTVKLRKDKVDQLIELLGDLTPHFLEVDPCLSPVDNFREVRASLRPGMTEAQNASLDLVVQQVQNKPSLSFK